MQQWSVLYMYVSFITTHIDSGCIDISEQLGQEILDNLQRDREKIQRSRARVSK